MPKDIKRYKLGEGELIYIRNWADDPEALYRAARKMPLHCRNCNDVSEVSGHRTADR